MTHARPGLTNMPKSKHRGHKTKTVKQVRFLLSVVSPLTAEQQARLKRELKSGRVKTTKKKVR